MTEWLQYVRAGMTNGASKLTPHEVRCLRQCMAAQLFSRASLAREFKVSRAALYHIETGRNWGYLGENGR